MTELDQQLSAHYPCHRLYESAEQDDYLARHGDTITAIVTRGDAGVPRRVMECLPRLRVIAVFGVGTDKIDLAYAASRGIQVSITRDILTGDVADLASTLVLAFSRNLIGYHAFAKAGAWAWANASPPLSSSVSGKRVGIVGLGNIGNAIAERLSAFGMDVGYYAKSPKAGNYRYMDSLTDLALFSDYLVLALSGGPHNEGLIDETILNALGSDGVLVNISRGSVVNEAHLIHALATKAIKGAALDVFQHEPLIPDALRGLDNVILTPHIGSATVETRNKMAANVLANLNAYFNGGTVLSPADMK
ncbi:dihydrofolate reductase [Chimaeribacter arupi]|uniref:Dihydrofolate reductase n=2 Tax=Chimaeribacter arupi TaxID=2060066 RepID=A0A2N5EL25_9GAMM|nr:dihydrofolate reductase [Chimaeribacter arupi]